MWHKALRPTLAPAASVGKASPVLPDGAYDAIVVDASAAADDTISLDLTILAGEQKGAVVAVAGPALGRDPIDLLGIPATVTVSGGHPSVRLEP